MPGDGDGKRAGLMQRRGAGDTADSDGDSEGSSMSGDESDAVVGVPVPLTGTKRAQASGTSQRTGPPRGAADVVGEAPNEPAAKRQRAMDRAELKASAKQSRAELGITGAWPPPPHPHRLHRTLCLNKHVISNFWWHPLLRP